MSNGRDVVLWTRYQWVAVVVTLTAAPIFPKMRFGVVRSGS